MKTRSRTAMMVLIHWFIISSLFYFSEIENLEFQINRIFPSANFDTASAIAINNNGHVVGNIGTFPAQSSYPFIYAENFVFDLASEVGINSTLVDINDLDEIIGVTRCESKVSGFSFATNGGIFRNLSNEGSVRAINSIGQIIGTQVVNSVPRPTIFFNNAALTLEVNAEFFDINNFLGRKRVGTIVGACKYEDSHVPCYMYDGEIHDLSVCEPGVAVAINDRDVIIGNCGNSSAFIIYRFVDYWIQPDSQFIDINEEGWILSQTESSPHLIIISNSTASKYTSYDLMDLLPSNSGITKLHPVALNNNGQIVANSNLGPVVLNPVYTAISSPKRNEMKKSDHRKIKQNSKK